MKFGLLGAAAGAMLGIILGLAVSLNADAGGDGAGGLAAALFFIPLFGVLGGLGGAFWFAARARKGPVGKGHVAAALIIVVLGVIAAGATI
jgi:hypothetical protein